MAIRMAWVVAVVLCVWVARGQDDLGEVEGAILREHLGQFWGAVAVRRPGGSIEAAGFGLRDGDSLAPIEGNSLFDVGSITKVVTALTVMSLVDDGVLSLDDTVREHVPGDYGDAEPVTIEQLLSHRAGLNDQAAMQRLDFPDRDEAVRLALAADRLFAPGEGWRYSNAGYVVLAAVVEHATGNAFEDEARRRVLVPAGMESSGFLDGLDALGRPLDRELFTARARRDGSVVGLLDDGYGWGLKGASGLLTSARDLLRLDEAFAAGRVVKPATAAAMTERQSGPNGLGWFVNETAWGGALVSHGGATRGYTAELRRYPENGAAVVVLTNTRWSAREMATLVERVVFADRRPRMLFSMNTRFLTLNENAVGTLRNPDLTVIDGNTGALIIARDPEIGFDGVVLSIVLNEVALERLIGQLAARVAADDPKGVDESELTLAFSPYDWEEDGGASVTGDSLSIEVDAMYRGVSEDGRRITDHRTLIRVVDSDRRFWPVLLKLGSADAEWLVRELEAVLEGSTE